MDFKRLIGKTRQEVVTIMGEPDDKSVGSRKHRIPLIYLYGKYEVAFGNGEKDGCVYVMNSETHSFIR